MREMNQPIYLICGVPGSGKTWVCEQLKDKFHYIPHDQHYYKHAEVIIKASRTSSKPIITEVPFAERVLRETLEKHDLKVIPYFVIDKPHTIADRYLKREKKKIPKNFLTRATTIEKRAIEWGAIMGDSSAILKTLKDI